MYHAQSTACTSAEDTAPKFRSPRWHACTDTHTNTHAGTDAHTQRHRDTDTPGIPDIHVTSAAVARTKEAFDVLDSGPSPHPQTRICYTASTWTNLTGCIVQPRRRVLACNPFPNCPLLGVCKRTCKRTRSRVTASTYSRGDAGARETCVASVPCRLPHRKHPTRPRCRADYSSVRATSQTTGPGTRGLACNRVLHARTAPEQATYMGRTEEQI